MWYIVAKADADGMVPETSESNNAYARSIQIGADLIISPLSAPAIAGAGQSISATETTKNQGGGNADPSVTKFYLSTNSTLDPSDVLIGSRSVPTLGAGTSSSASTTLTIPPETATGMRYIVAKADADGVVPETSESNNTYARSIQIGADLIISPLSAPPIAGAGQSISVTETTKNQGGGNADPSVTKFYLSTNSTLDPSDVLIGSRNVPTLGAGTSSSASTTLTIPPGTSTGVWYIVAKTDADGVVAETSENNNAYARSIQISTGPS
jgi:subtilase family serine protease